MTISIFGDDPVRTAEFSPCRRWRYVLNIIWDATKPPLVFVMLNPSTADELANDPTVERCERRAREYGYGGVIILNCFAWRDTEPAGMKKAADPVGAENDAWITATLVQAKVKGGAVICAWGTHAVHQERDLAVIKLICATGIRPQVLMLTKHGHPRHPLYVPYAECPKVWDVLARNFNGKAPAGVWINELEGR